MISILNNINIYFIRHGLSRGNLNPQKIGQSSDEPLTDKGIEQATKLGQRFLNQNIKFDKIFSSTYLRAKHTAEIIAKLLNHNEIIFSDALIEYDPGEWKGKDRRSIYSDHKASNKIINHHMHFKFPNGESYNQVARRVAIFVEDNIIHNEGVLSLAKLNKINIGVFSHAMTIKSFICYAIGIDGSSMSKIRIDNTAIQHLVFNEQGWHLYSLNDAGHLL